MPCKHTHRSRLNRLCYILIGIGTETETDINGELMSRSMRRNYLENEQLHVWQFYLDNQGKMSRIHLLQPEEAYITGELMR